MQKSAEPKSGKSARGLDPDKSVENPAAVNTHESPNRRKTTLSLVAGGKQSSPAGAHTATGPRTAAGKKRSSRNALKSGIFSQVVVLDGEPRAQFDALLEGFRDYFQPLGVPEDVLVEKLATLCWRRRRLLAAEGAEIRRGAEFIESNRASEWRQEMQQVEQDRQSAPPDARPGLIDTIQNPNILARCIELLVELRDGIKTDGFDEEPDMGILEMIYGDERRVRVRQTLLDSYDSWVATSQTSEEVRKGEGYASPADCNRNFATEIDLEILRLEQFQRSQTSIEAARSELDRLGFNVPESHALDRLIRYEASLDRSFARTLDQLERLQRIRRGQPVPSTLKVEVNN